MSYQPDALKFTVLFTDEIWAILDAVAFREGHITARDMINQLTRETAAVFQNQVTCTGLKKEKRQNTYQVPRHLEKTFKALSCKTGLPVSTLMTMRLLDKVLFHLAVEGDNQEDK